MENISFFTSWVYRVTSGINEKYTETYRILRLYILYCVLYAIILYTKSQQKEYFIGAFWFNL